MLSFFFFHLFGHAIQHVKSYYPNQGSNPHTLYLKYRVLASGPPGKSHIYRMLVRKGLCRRQVWKLLLVHIAFESSERQTSSQD